MWSFIKKYNSEIILALLFGIACITVIFFVLDLIIYPTAPGNAEIWNTVSNPSSFTIIVVMVCFWQSLVKRIDNIKQDIYRLNHDITILKLQIVDLKEHLLEANFYR